MKQTQGKGFVKKYGDFVVMTSDGNKSFTVWSALWAAPIVCENLTDANVTFTGNVKLVKERLEGHNGPTPRG